MIILFFWNRVQSEFICGEESQYIPVKYINNKAEQFCISKTKAGSIVRNIFPGIKPGFVWFQKQSLRVYKGITYRSETPSPLLNCEETVKSNGYNIISSSADKIVASKPTGQIFNNIRQYVEVEICENSIEKITVRGSAISIQSIFGTKSKRPLEEDLHLLSSLRLCIGHEK